MKALSAARHLAVGLLVALAYTGVAGAAPILCQNPANNHMKISDTQVSACLDAGKGNLTGNPMNDLFLNGAGAGLGYVPLGKDDGGSNPFNVGQTQSGSTGTWGFDANIWDEYDTIAIGFKFGTGNKPDEWFVFEVVSDIFSGDWKFVNVFGRGGGLSHVNLYGILGTGDNGEDPPQGIPEPGILFLLGAGLLAIMGIRRRQAT